jgi:hypothetical protein
MAAAITSPIVTTITSPVVTTIVPIVIIAETKAKPYAAEPPPRVSIIAVAAVVVVVMVTPVSDIGE